MYQILTKSNTPKVFGRRYSSFGNLRNTTNGVVVTVMITIYRQPILQALESEVGNNYWAGLSVFISSVYISEKCYYRCTCRIKLYLRKGEAICLNGDVFSFYIMQERRAENDDKDE